MKMRSSTTLTPVLLQTTMTPTITWHCAKPPTVKYLHIPVDVATAFTNKIEDRTSQVIVGSSWPAGISSNGYSGQTLVLSEGNTGRIKIYLF
jgi:hypothetical protein